MFSVLIKKALCWLSNHKLQAVQPLTELTAKVKCDRCHRYYELDQLLGRLSHWDFVYEAYYCTVLRVKETAK